MHEVSILIADDDPTIRQCLRRALEVDPRLQVCWEASNGLEALMMAKQHHPKVVLLDARMPRMDGIEATRCLRRHDPTQCILVVSVYDQAREQAIAAGANDFVTLDCGCENLRAAIHRALLPAEEP